MTSHSPPQSPHLPPSHPLPPIPATTSFTYISLGCANPASSTWPETYDREDQFVVVIRDLPRIGIYKACMVSDSEIAFLN